MTIHRTKLLLIVFIILLSGCAQQAQPVIPTATLPPPTQTNAPPTKTPTATPTETPTAIPTPTIIVPVLFGAIAQNQVQAYSLDPIANAIFRKVMDNLIANGSINDYAVASVTVFPTGDGAFYAEITYNVRTADPSWLTDGGIQADNNWINEKCNRFDFVTTATEFQLKNRRTCN